LIDIIVFALPADSKRAVAIPDGLIANSVAGQNRTRFITEHPNDVGWMEAVRAAEASSCVIFCWSNATAAPEIEPLRKLAERIYAADHAIAVELDANTTPSALANCTTYPLYGWRAYSGGWQRFVHGNGFVTQIAAAAEQKVLGIDPPLPAAYSRMVRAQAWAALVGSVALLSLIGTTLGFYRDSFIAKKLDPKAEAAFEAAKASKNPCPALRAFGKAHNGSAWSQEASELLQTCTRREVSVAGPQVIEMPVASLSSKPDTEQVGRKLCETYSHNLEGTVLSAQLAEYVPAGTSTVRCSVRVLQAKVIETIGR
jgi:hypothetical protein